MRVDRVAILDWSAAKGAKRGKDSIWLGVADRSGTTAVNIPTRALASDALHGLIHDTLGQGLRLLIGVDFAFGFPDGFAGALTGTASALSVWDWLSERITDTPDNISNYRQVAASMNARFNGGGPFWGNGTRLDVAGLPRLKPPLPPGLGAHRHCDIMARESGAWPKSVWQLAGAGAVGAQGLTGLPVLNALRRTFGPAVCVWPFDATKAPVLLAEVYPSMLRTKVMAECAAGVVADKAQVSLMARALFAHSENDGLGALMVPQAAPAILVEEGWMLASGQSTLLNSVLA
jgi:hypothetical protein